MDKKQNIVRVLHPENLVPIQDYNGFWYVIDIRGYLIGPYTSKCQAQYWIRDIRHAKNYDVARHGLGKHPGAINGKYI